MGALKRVEGVNATLPEDFLSPLAPASGSS